VVDHVFLLDVGHLPLVAVRRQDAVVGRLTATFGVKERPVEGDPVVEAALDGGLEPTAIGVVEVKRSRHVTRNARN